MSTQEIKSKQPKSNKELDSWDLLNQRQKRQFDRRRDRTPYPIGAIGDKNIIKSQQMAQKEEIIQRTFKGEQYGTTE